MSCSPAPKIPPTKGNPTGLAMPAFDWKLDDKEVADLVNYIRNAWGNHASLTSADTVSKVRKNVEHVAADFLKVRHSLDRSRIDVTSETSKGGSNGVLPRSSYVALPHAITIGEAVIARNSSDVQTVQGSASPVRQGQAAIGGS